MVDSIVSSITIDIPDGVYKTYKIKPWTYEILPVTNIISQLKIGDRIIYKPNVKYLKTISTTIMDIMIYNNWHDVSPMIHPK